jgi:hypothetical protein
MKNILAENMLRFGAKNLKSGDIKQIQKAMLSEDVVINGVTYKYPFKDANQINTSYLGNAAPWTESAAAAAGRFNKMESSDLTSLKTLSALYPDMLLELAKKGITPEQLKKMSGKDRYVIGLLNTAAATPEGMAMVKQKGGWANPQALRQNMSSQKVSLWALNWFIPTFEKAFKTAFPQGLPAAAPQNPQAPQAPTKM